MKDPDPIGADKRRAWAARELPADAACVCCGETNKLVLERHHIAGASNDKVLTVVLCRTHHHLMTIGQLDLGVDLAWRKSGDTLLERLVAVLRGLAVFFESLAHALMAWADRLAALIAALDARCPGWRTIPQAQPQP